MADKRNPVIKGVEMDGKVVYVEFIDGRTYKLQHPGNRMKMRWEKECFNPIHGLDLEQFMDRAFEHCVIPEGHNFHPTVDEVEPRELEVWIRLIRRFLDGDLDIILGKGEASGGASVRGAKAP